jgi:hypothetical protein
MYKGRTVEARWDQISSLGVKPRKMTATIGMATAAAISTDPVVQGLTHDQDCFLALEVIPVVDAATVTIDSTLDPAI